jgi:hypothetical protein
MIRPKQIPTSSFQTDLSDSEQSREIPETPYSRQPGQYSLPSFILFLPHLPLFWQIEVRPVTLPARNHAENRLCVSAVNLPDDLPSRVKTISLPTSIWKKSQLLEPVVPV